MIRIMEICGTHTMAIAKAGIKSLLPYDVKLISGPGCPVCVTDSSVIDEILKLADLPGVIIASYGDMIRVPGSARFGSESQNAAQTRIECDSLKKRMAAGADVRVVYSPMDALDIARDNPDKELIFLGVGFETTAPGTAAAIKAAASRELKNFTVLSMLKTVQAPIRALAAQADFNIDGFLCPGHVASIIGEAGFEFLPRDLSLPGVIAGFEPEEIMTAIAWLLKMIDGRNMAAVGEIKQDRKSDLKGLANAYKRAVSKGGNLLALEMMNEVFEPGDDLWRGLGFIKDSALKIRSEYSQFDACVKFDLPQSRTLAMAEGGCQREKELCRCGDIICGRAEPCICPLFSKLCTPENPVGPCMVSSEGACAAYYKYL